MSDIFLSYKNEDRPRAKIIAEALEQHGYSVWWDRKIPPGKKFDQVIEEALDASKCVIVLWSKESISSDWVKNEAREGARRHILVPVLMDDIKIPFEFRHIQAAKLIDWQEALPNLEFNQLLTSVTEIVYRLPSQKTEIKNQSINGLDISAQQTQEEAKRLEPKKEENERQRREEEEIKEELKAGEGKEQLSYKKFIIVIGVLGIFLGGYLIYPTQTTGSISVNSSPSGASIYLDGSYQGITPMIIKNVRVDSHTITLKLKGYQDLSQTTNVNTDETTYVSTNLIELPEYIPTPTLIPTPAQIDLPRGVWKKISDFPLKVNTLIVDPTNPRVLYAGSGGGVYKSEDAGLTWNLTTQEMIGDNVMALAMTREVPHILYADADGKIFSSINDAKSWNRLGDPMVSSGFWHYLIIAPSDRHVLFNIAIPGGVARSDDDGYNWQSVYKGLPREENRTLALSLAIDPKDKNVVYMGTGGWVDWMPGYGVYKSTDEGETWSPANRGIENNRIIALAIDPSQPQIIYASASGGKLFKSINGGQTWENISANLIVQDDSNPDLTQIIIDTTAPDTIYLLREQLGAMVSKDGGVSWHLIGKPPVESKYHAFTVAIIFNKQPVLIFGVENEGGWRYSAES